MTAGEPIRAAALDGLAAIRALEQGDRPGAGRLVRAAAVGHGDEAGYRIARGLAISAGVRLLRRLPRAGREVVPITTDEVGPERWRSTALAAAIAAAVNGDNRGGRALWRQLDDRARVDLVADLVWRNADVARKSP